MVKGAPVRALHRLGDVNRSMQMATRVNGAPKPVGLGKEKLALIHVARRDCRLGDDDYRTILQEAGGVTSAQALSEAGFRKVMERFKALGFVHRPKAGGAAAVKDRFGRRAGMATPEQVALIEAMWSRWASADAGAAGLAHWLEKRFGVSSLRFATVQTAQMAIEGLKAMLARRESPKAPEQAGCDQ